MFQLLILRHLSKENGECFTVRKNHAFLVELPTQLSNTHEPTRLSDVLKWFGFFGDRINDAAISFLEIYDDVGTTRPIYPKSFQNKLTLKEKEKFVFKYLDALDKGDLVNAEEKEDWNYITHPDADSARMWELLNKYASRGVHILSQKKK
ncbi:hypothetical protein RFI_14219 [Reticulomyxa filosa]|uniref:Uncharacterized protein n=1 Tax=Reticulomyxa filosa TaxID=46433 RepID=X6NAD0_RETFI|nr:hypothetical protein RFI_14219 [Reticulomyxa filosa]|eukprot:ETO22966.1 hypothetical protein RFI_14219 [Reticulomyxa filosa]